MKRSKPCPPDTFSALAGLHLLSECPVEDLVRLCRDADLVDIPAGDVIDRAGTRARQLVGIVDGYVHGVTPDGEAVVLGPGEQFGAAELIDAEPHSMTYTSVAATTTIVVFGPAFHAVAPSIPGLAATARWARAAVTPPPAALLVAALVP